MDIYRKIWEQHNGSVPKESDGRSYEIHHIDGNHSNNDISNLKCVTIQEHFDIHYAQKDYAACLLISKRMSSSEIDSKTRSLLSKDNANKRMKEGTHNFLDREFQISRGINNRTKQLELVKNGNHVFKQIMICPKCKHEGKGAVMKRWHFDNCKNE